MIQGMQEGDNDDNNDQDNNNNKSKSNCRGRSCLRNRSTIDGSGHQCIVIKDTVKELFDQPKVRLSNTPINLNRKLMLDSRSTIEATIKNSGFLTNIRKSENPIVMSTNARYKKMGLDLSLIHI